MTGYEFRKESLAWSSEHVTMRMLRHGSIPPRDSQIWLPLEGELSYNLQGWW